MAAVADFGRKLDLVLKTFNLSRGRLAQTVGIDKSVVSRWTSGATVPTDHNLSLLTDVVVRHQPAFRRLDWELALPAFSAKLGVTAPAAVAATSPVPTSPVPTSALALPDRPSIAVLLFANMSDDPGQDYFADGMAEDIITALSRFKSLFVIARNSSFSYKGKSPDIRQVGRELEIGRAHV